MLDIIYYMALQWGLSSQFSTFAIRNFPRMTWIFETNAQGSTDPIEKRCSLKLQPCFYSFNSWNENVLRRPTGQTLYVSLYRKSACVLSLSFAPVSSASLPANVFLHSHWFPFFKLWLFSICLSTSVLSLISACVSVPVFLFVKLLQHFVLT